MSILFRRRGVQPRKFSYEPRFYDPTKDDRLKRRMRAARPRVRRKSKQPTFIAVGLGLLLALYLYLHIDSIVERVAAFSSFFFGG
ncbi:MAG: hypothetical protein IIB09_02585 [Bacteroidetes bacterium]|nr:hypothetical protein [Bacteroidota bacterium]